MLRITPEETWRWCVPALLTPPSREPLDGRLPLEPSQCRIWEGQKETPAECYKTKQCLAQDFGSYQWVFFISHFCNLFENFEKIMIVFILVCCFIPIKVLYFFSPKYEIYLLIYLGQFILSDQANILWVADPLCQLIPHQRRILLCPLGHGREKRKKMDPTPPPAAHQKVHTACDE